MPSRGLFTKEKAETETCLGLERVMGIEPTSQAWEARILPMNYTRKSVAIIAVSNVKIKGFLLTRNKKTFIRKTERSVRGNVIQSDEKVFKFLSVFRNYFTGIPLITLTKVPPPYYNIQDINCALRTKFMYRKRRYAL